MSTYLYSGAPSAATLPDGRDVILMPGASVELPEDNAWVQTLVALGHLAPRPVPVKPPKGKGADNAG